MSAEARRNFPGRGAETFLLSEIKARQYRDQLLGQKTDAKIDITGIFLLLSITKKRVVIRIFFKRGNYSHDETFLFLKEGIIFVVAWYQFLGTLFGMSHLYQTSFHSFAAF
jgi:hypothetical protein